MRPAKLRLFGVGFEDRVIGADYLRAGSSAPSVGTSILGAVFWGGFKEVGFGGQFYGDSFPVLNLLRFLLNYNHLIELLEPWNLCMFKYIMIFLSL